MAALLGAVAALLVAGLSSAAGSGARRAQVAAFTAASSHVSTRGLDKLSSAAAGSGRLEVGSAPLAPLHSTVVGALAAGIRLSVAIALKPQNPTQMSDLATAVATPGSSSYHDYLTVSQFRARFGASTTAIAALRSTLAKSGLSLGATSPNGLSVDATGTAAELEQAFATKLERLALPGGRIAYSNASTPTLPAAVAADVESVMGLSDVFLPHREGLARRAGSTRHGLLGSTSHAAAPAAATTVADPALTGCSAADAEAVAVTEPAEAGVLPASTSYTGQSIAQAYDFDPLYATGDEGQGVNVGVFELEPNDPSDITAFESCYGITAPVTYQQVDGGAGTFSAADGDGEETELDIDNIIELAPKASVEVFQAPNSSAGSYDQYSDMVTGVDGKLSVISSSWGECEELEGSTAASAENDLFEEGALQGISIVAAAGDAGAEDCEISLEGIVDANLPEAAVDDPASQPFVTGAGGTSLNAIGDPPTTAPTQVTWNNGAVLAISGKTDIIGGGGAGGGGVSELWQMPDYQVDASTALNVVNSESSDLTCSPLEDDCREVPDVSADADPYTGYVIYWDGGWTAVGGTSGAAPLWAGLFADADSNSGCTAKGGIGFANPDLYAAAGSSTANYASDFSDITSGNNDLYDTNGGEFAAGAGYDMATGLGTPVAANLVPALCSASTLSTGTVTVQEPGSVTTASETDTDTVTGPTTTDTETETVSSTATEPGSTSTSTSTVTGPGHTTTGPTVVEVTPPKTVTKTVVKKASCRIAKELSFVQHPTYPVRETKAVVYINGKVVKTLQGKRIVDVLVKRPAATKFTLRLIATLSTGAVISHQITYDGCTQSKTITKVLHKGV